MSSRSYHLSTEQVKIQRVCTPWKWRNNTVRRTALTIMQLHFSNGSIFQIDPMSEKKIV